MNKSENTAEMLVSGNSTIFLNKVLKFLTEVDKEFKLDKVSPEDVDELIDYFAKELPSEIMLAIGSSRLEAKELMEKGFEDAAKSNLDAANFGFLVLAVLFVVYRRVRIHEKAD